MNIPPPLESRPYINYCYYSHFFPSFYGTVWRNCTFCPKLVRRPFCPCWAAFPERLRLQRNRKDLLLTKAISSCTLIWLTNALWSSRVIFIYKLIIFWLFFLCWNFSFRYRSVCRCSSKGQKWKERHVGYKGLGWSWRSYWWQKETGTNMICYYFFSRP